MKREADIAERVAQNVLSTYPDTPPTQEDKKKWRERSEKERRKEGIQPRK
jgi:TolA-binding protein